MSDNLGDNVTTSLETWTYTRDTYGDWRGISADGTRRTRLKTTRAAAERDAAAHRFQRRIGNEWIDAIDGPRSRVAMPE